MTEPRSWAGCGDATGLSCPKWSSEMVQQLPKHPAEKTELSQYLWQHYEKVGTCDAILCSVPALTFLGIRSQLGVAAPCPSTATSCSPCPAEWWPRGDLCGAGVCVQLWAITNEQSSSHFLKLDLSLVSSIQVNSLCTLWESCGLFSYLGHHKVFHSLGVLDGSCWNCPFFSLFWNCSFL